MFLCHQNLRWLHLLFLLPSFKNIQISDSLMFHHSNLVLKGMKEKKESGLLSSSYTVFVNSCSIKTFWLLRPLCFILKMANCFVIGACENVMSHLKRKNVTLFLSFFVLCSVWFSLILIGDIPGYLKDRCA